VFKCLGDTEARTYYPRWIPRNYRMRRHVVCYHGSGRNNPPITYADPRQDYAAESEPAIPADSHDVIAIPLLSRAHPILFSDRHSNSIGGMVPLANDSNVIGDYRVISNSAIALDGAPFADIDVLSYHKPCGSPYDCTNTNM